MSRDLMDESYYVSHGGKIPVKWTAPEVSLYVVLHRLAVPCNPSPFVNINTCSSKYTPPKKNSCT